MTKKYKLTHHIKVVEGHTLHRIKALKSFDDVRKGDLGGWVESYNNLSQSDTAWVYDNAMVYENAKIGGQAQILDNAWVFDYTFVYGNAMVLDNAKVYGVACIYDHAQVLGNAQVSGNAWIYNNAHICRPLVKNQAPIPLDSVS